VNTTGTIDSAYKVGVLFNSSYSSVTQNHTNNATIQISGGNLIVNLTYPPIGTTNVNQYSTFNVNATVTCVDSACGTVYGTVRYNASSANPDTPINTTEGATPFYITSGERKVRPVYYTTQTGGGSAINETKAYDNDYNDTTTYAYVFSGTVAGYWARVNYTFSIGASSARLFATSNYTFGYNSGELYIYNFSSDSWEFWLSPSTALATNSTPINSSSGLINSTGHAILSVYAILLVDQSDILLYDTYASYVNSICGSLSKDQSCQLNWTVNTTGTIDSAYKVGVLFNSSYSSVTQNHTNNATIQITGGRLEVNLTYPPNMIVNQNATFNVNATVTCRNGSCGNVFGTVQYNDSSANPDTAVNTTEGATPFYITGGDGIPTATTTTVETGGIVGMYSSIAVDSQGFVHISHYNGTGADLRYCNNTLGTWTCTDVETGGNVGQYSSIAVDSQGYVHISHYDETEDDLRYCNNTLGTWTCTDVETTGLVGSYSSIAIDSNDKVHISHYDLTSDYTRYCNNTLGTWTCANAASGYFSSMAIDSNDKVHISTRYSIDESTFYLYYCNNTLGTWTCANVDIGGSVGFYSSIAIDSNDKVHISHQNDTGYDLRYCNNTLGSWTCTNVDTGGLVGLYSSIAIDSNNKVHISHYDDTNKALRYCYTNDFSTWNCQKVVDTGSIIYTHGRSIAIKKGVLATSTSFSPSVHISYFNYTTYDLMYAKLSKNSLSCGSLSQDQSCQLNWTVNATGAIDSAYKVGVLFNSSYSTVTKNHTNNATITIIECTENMNIGWSSIYFGNLRPNTTSNSAPGNLNNIYNITNTGTCTLKIWIKGTDIQNTSLPYPNIIGVSNFTWSNTTNDYSSSYAMTESYDLLNSSLTPTIKNITTYYWLRVPPVYAGNYTGTLYICENTTQQSGLTSTCT
jgi:hypothetical protein